MSKSTFAARWNRKRYLLGSEFPRTLASAYVNVVKTGTSTLALVWQYQRPSAKLVPVVYADDGSEVIKGVE